MLATLSAEGIDRQKMHEWRQGYPKATEADDYTNFEERKMKGRAHECRQ
jgi:hypothetical protein